ncbi:MAG: hypothetical protein IJX27_00385 [Clostridia bacterium]|nr:hypothetical protein [Clostridia bacterium]
MESRRYLCWDENLIENNSGARVCAHRPEKKNLALICDSEWEGPHNGYASIVGFGETYRMYYRACTMRQKADGSLQYAKGVICMAESRDGGITFKKPNIGKYEYNGTKNNNIIFDREGEIDNFSVFYDENPACPKEEKFKALSEINLGHERGGTKLIYYASENGIDFREMRYLDVAGTFDSFNVTFWDAETGKYFLYYRAFHGKNGEDKLSWRGVKKDDIRDIRVATSADFLHWEVHGRITFAQGQEDYPLYTNQITKYRRAASTFIGFPVRYIDRCDDAESFRFMPLADRRGKITEHFGREGTALTDCVIMTSQDGLEFDRRDEAFMTPGMENRNNWWYGNCYTVYGLCETEAEEEGAPKEISFYMGENYRIKNVNFRRYTVRLDGFFSWQAPYSDAEVLTKPLALSGEEMSLNFSTSAVGGIKIYICDVNGEELEGYESYTVFGNSVERPVEFAKPLAALAGETVRLKFKMKDAEIYSFVI